MHVREVYLENGARSDQSDAIWTTEFCSVPTASRQKRFATIMRNATSKRFAWQIHFRLARDASSFGIRATFFIWPNGWCRSYAGFPELQRSAVLSPLSGGPYIQHRRLFNSAALDRRRNGGGAVAAASLSRSRYFVPRATVQNGDPVRPNSARLGRRLAAACRDLGVPRPIEVPFSASASEAIYRCGPRV